MLTIGNELDDESDTLAKPLTTEDLIKLQDYLTAESCIYAICCWLADRDGVDDPHHLIYEGYPGEPWGEVWQKYEFDAKELIKIVLNNDPNNSANNLGNEEATEQCIT